MNDIGLTSTSPRWPAAGVAWGRIAFHVCSQAEIDSIESAPVRTTGDCLDGYTTRNDDALIRRYQVAPGAVVLLLSNDGADAMATKPPGGVHDLDPLAGQGKLFEIAADALGDVATIGEVFVP